MDTGGGHVADAAIALRAIVVDDHRIVLDGLRRLIETVPGWEVVATCERAEDALQVLADRSADIVIADLRMPQMDGLEFIRRVRGHGKRIAVIILTADIADDQIAEAMRLGVNGIVLKEQAPDTLLDCIGAVAAGKTYFQDQALRSALDRIRTQEAVQTPGVELLTQREIEVSRLAASGIRSKEIGAKLGISPGTVKLHLHSIYSKLGISTRVELANLANRLPKSPA
ncbi:MAG TPA: response regulator transcription factor [Ensifer sp.]|jgi:DNA-binding NarL/FixJ family response regulator|uniref:response regulator transcription factor n=1 Tax=Ensifer sp. TaxID=1872086 RepID=UPI002E115116|nr:response regulator transcription factor [Ensifer sp.]